MQRLDCYIVEQIESAPYTAGRLSLPEVVSGNATYQVQYGRKLDFGAAGQQVVTLRVPAGIVSSATLDALLSGVGTGNLTLKLDIGNNGAWDFQRTQTVTDTTTLTTDNLAAGFNSYWETHGAPTSGTLDVPVKVSLSKPGQVLLTNLQLSGAGSKLRYVRLPARPHSQFLLDFQVGGSGSNPLALALDVGDDGSIDWTYSGSPTLPQRLLTGDLSAAISAYLSGKNGDVLVPLRFYVAPDRSITLMDYQAASTANVDLGAGAPGQGVAAAAIKEGDIVPLQATLSNSGAANSGPVTAAFFAVAPGWGDWYIGSDFVTDIAPGGSAAVAIDWNTTGFYGDVAVKVMVNPYGRTGETNFANNTGNKSFSVQPKAKQSQTISFGKLPARTLGDPPFTLSATATSGLPVSFTSTTPTICTVSGNTVTLVAGGSCTIRASQAGDALYAAAPEVSQTFTVRTPTQPKLDQTITFAKPQDRTVGDAPFKLGATASSGLSVSFASTTSTVCTVSGNTVALVDAGQCTIVASQAGNNTYNAAPKVSRTFTVNPLGGSPDVYLPEVAR